MFPTRKILKDKEFVKKSPYSTFTQDVNWAKVKENWSSDILYDEKKHKEFLCSSM